MATFEQKFHNKKGDRARKEVDVVEACIEHIDIKLNDLDARLSALQQTMDQLLDQYSESKRMGASEIELQRMSRRYKRAENEQRNIEDIMRLFMSTQDALVYLGVQLDSLIMLEWYGYIVRVVPEKKLPKMIRSENADDMRKVGVLTEKMVSKIKNHIMLRVKDEAERRKIMDRIEATAKSIIEKRSNETDSEMTSSIEAALAKRKGKPVSIPVPVDAGAGASAAAKKTVKA